MTAVFPKIALFSCSLKRSCFFKFVHSRKESKIHFREWFKTCIFKMKILSVFRHTATSEGSVMLRYQNNSTMSLVSQSSLRAMLYQSSFLKNKLFFFFPSIYGVKNRIHYKVKLLFLSEMSFLFLFSFFWIQIKWSTMFLVYVYCSDPVSSITLSQEKYSFLHLLCISQHASINITVFLFHALLSCYI